MQGRVFGMRFNEGGSDFGVRVIGMVGVGVGIRVRVRVQNMAHHTQLDRVRACYSRGLGLSEWGRGIQPTGCGLGVRVTAEMS